MADKLADLIRDRITRSPFLSMGFSLEVLNLSALARVLRPQLAAAFDGELSDGAVHKALTRYAGMVTKQGKIRPESFALESLSIQGDVMILTYGRSREKHKTLAKWYEKALSEGKFFNITESSSEISVFTDASIGKAMVDKTSPIIVYKELTALRAAFHKKFLSRPGFIVSILQRLSMQGVNIVEVSSTTTELIIFLESRDTMAAFDALYYSMVERSGARGR